MFSKISLKIFFDKCTKFLQWGVTCNLQVTTPGMSKVVAGGMEEPWRWEGLYDLRRIHLILTGFFQIVGPSRDHVPGRKDGTRYLAPSPRLSKKTGPGC